MTDDYSKAVSKLGPDYRSAIKAFETKLMKGLESPGLHIEPIEGCLAEGLKSGRINDDLRAILLLEPLTLLYVDHHDRAYEWARRSRVSLANHGGAVIVYESPQTAETIDFSRPEERADLFQGYEDDYLVETIGVPREFIPPLRRLAEASSILELEGRFPGIVLDRLLDIAEGRMPDLDVAVADHGSDSSEQPAVLGAVTLDEHAQESLDLVAHGDRRQWLEFIGAKQKRIAQEGYDRPVVLTGPAGTGKTVVLLHRAATLAKVGKSVLLVTIGHTLASQMKSDLDLLAGKAPWRERIDARWLHDLICELRDAATEAGFDVPTQRIVYGAPVQQALDQAAEEVRGEDKRSRFWYLDEWNLILEPQAIDSLEAYLKASRPGRGQALQRPQRESEWAVFERAVELLKEQDFVPLRLVVAALLRAYENHHGQMPRWGHILVDEFQDLGKARMRLMLALTGDTSGVFFAGDSSQRLFVPPTDIAEVGIEVVRRRLTRSHRTTEAIRHFVEVDLGLREQSDRSNGSRSGGAEPEVHCFADELSELTWIRDYCQRFVADGYDPADLGLVLKDNASVGRMINLLRTGGLPCYEVTAGSACHEGIAVLNRHRAKGLEFNTVLVAQLTADAIEPDRWDWMPSAQRDANLEFIRNVIYVALTRARERLIVTCGGALPRGLESNRMLQQHLEPVADSVAEEADADDGDLYDIPF